MEPAIIITNNEKEAIELHEFLGDTEFKQSIESGKVPSIVSYNSVWYWHVDHRGVGGSSGAHALKNYNKIYPDYPVYFLSGFKKRSDLLKKAIHLIEQYTETEAGLIGDDECWNYTDMASTPLFTSELWDKLVELQQLRNDILDAYKEQSIKQ